MWALEKLGPDQWRSLDESSVYGLMFWCHRHNSGDRMQRLLQVCPGALDARGILNNYSLLHQNICSRSNINLLLSMGANVNLLGFALNWSPKWETPISLSLYRADTFLELQQALDYIGSKSEDFVDQELKTRSWPCSLGRETLVELFSEHLDLSSILYKQPYICPYCSKPSNLMVQPYWMRILESFKNRSGSQTVKDILQTMQSTRAKSAAGEDDEHGRESSYLPSHIQTQCKANPDVESE